MDKYFKYRHDNLFNPSLHALKKLGGSGAVSEIEDVVTQDLNLSEDAIKLPFSLIDYLLVHELVLTKVKNHSKEFWAEVSKHVPNWKELDEKMEGMKF